MKFVICEYYFGNGKKEFVQIVTYANSDAEIQEGLELIKRYRNGQAGYEAIVEEIKDDEPMWKGGWA